MYIPKYFQASELVSPDLFFYYEEYLHPDMIWKLFDQDILKAIDWMRERYGGAVINNWKVGGNYKDSGLRTKDTNHYSAGSMHSVGKAVDMKFKTSPIDIEEDFREMMKKGEPIPYFTRMEAASHTPSWVHIDTKPVKGLEDGKIHIFNP